MCPKACPVLSMLVHAMCGTVKAALRKTSLRPVVVKEENGSVPYLDARPVNLRSTVIPARQSFYKKRMSMDHVMPRGSIVPLMLVSVRYGMEKHARCKMLPQAVSVKKTSGSVPYRTAFLASLQRMLSHAQPRGSPPVQSVSLASRKVPSAL
jgi:hypothetical protein